MIQSVFNVGLASYGMSGSVFHVPLLLCQQHLNFYALVQRKENTIHKLFPKVKVYSSFEEMILDEVIDIVVVNTPPQYHFEQSAAALKAGKHVIVEKPFTVYSNEATELIELAKQHGKMLTVFQNRRLDGDFLLVKDCLESGKLGKINEASIRFDRFRPIVESSWKEANQPGNGALYNLGSHLLDQALTLFGKPAQLYAKLRKVREHARVNDCFDIELSYENLIVRLSCNYLAYKPGPKWLIHGSEGSFSKYGDDVQEAQLKLGLLPCKDGNFGLESEDQFAKIYLQNAERHGIGQTGDLTKRGNYDHFYTNIYQHLIANKPLLVRPEEARDVIFLIEKAMESDLKQSCIDLHFPKT